MSVRGPKDDSLKAARIKDKKRRRKPPAEDDTPVESIEVKSPSRRYEKIKR